MTDFLQVVLNVVEIAIKKHEKSEITAILDRRLDKPLFPQMLNLEYVLSCRYQLLDSSWITDPNDENKVKITMKVKKHES